jgi:hypothetical protein
MYNIYEKTHNENEKQKCSKQINHARSLSGGGIRRTINQSSLKLPADFRIFKGDLMGTPYTKNMVTRSRFAENAEDHLRVIVAPNRKITCLFISCQTLNKNVTVCIKIV